MMNDPPGSGQAAGADAVGLCRTCAHAQIVANDRGSIFYRCRLSAGDPRFPRYPRLPVTSCIGYEPRRSE